MKDFLLDLLVCSFCEGRLKLNAVEWVNDEIESGSLTCACGKEYAIRNGIPRFVNSDDYVSNFSLEWNRFAKTQLDSLNKTKISADRFKEVSGLDPEWLKGKTVLEAGCGMGRFLEVVAETGSQVVGIDLSFSVDAARNNLKRFANIHLIQADLFNPPLLKKRFDLIYSIGVLHHTPNPKEAFLRISHLLRKNGEIAIWISPKSRFPFFPKATNLARIFTPKMKPQVLLNLVEKFVPLVLPLIRIPFIGQYLKGWVIPLCDYEGQLPLSKEELVEWSILDTFDLLSPKYLYPYSEEEIRQWCLEAGLSDIYTLSPPVILRAKRY